jgi:signal transduction histidine kinase
MTQKPNKHLPNIFYSIQTKLVITFLIAALIILGLVLFFNQSIQQQLVEKADEALLVEAQVVANHIDDFNERNLQALQVASRLPIFTDYLLNPNEHTALETINTIETLESLQITPWNQFYALSYAILDAHGINVADTIESNVGNNESWQTYFTIPFTTGQSYTSSIYYQAERGGIYYFFSVPIRLKDEDTTVGILRARVAVSTLQDIIFEAGRDSRNDTHIALFDEHLVRLADTKHTNLLFRGITPIAADTMTALKVESLLPPIPNEDLVVSLPILADAITSMNHTTLINGLSAPDDAETERIAIARLESANWHVVVAQPLSIHYLPVRRQMQGTLILGFSLAITALVSSVGLSHLITDPIRKLTSTATKISSGDLTARAEVVSRDEIGILAQTFNEMTADLERMTETLEHRVEERTQELQQANYDLQHEMAERKRYEEQALQYAIEQERQRILIEFIQDASHEFKTPLSIINVNLHLLKRYKVEGQSKQISAIENQSHAISELVDNMVLMAKLDSGAVGAREHLVVNSFMQSLVINVTSAFKAKSLHLETDLQPDLMMIAANSDELWQAFQKILDNAYLYTDAGGQVTIRTCKQNDTAIIEIIDNGMGISEVALPRVFERFFREDEAHTTRGFGLGLPIAKRIIEIHGGTIELNSILGQGTTVIIRFPLVTDDTLIPE